MHKSGVVSASQLQYRENRRNRSYQPVPYVAGGWTSNSGALYVGSVDSIKVRRPGTSSRKFVRSASTPNVTIASVYGIGLYNSTVRIPVVPGETIVGSFWATCNTKFRVYANCFASDSSEVTIGSTVNGAYVFGEADQWVRCFVTQLMPANAALYRLGGVVSLEAGNVTVGTEITNMQDSLIETGSTPTDYFDGDYPDSDATRHEWLAIARQSASIEQMRVI